MTAEGIVVSQSLEERENFSFFSLFLFAPKFNEIGRLQFADNNAAILTSRGMKKKTWKKFKQKNLAFI